MIVIGLGLYAYFGDPAGGNDSAPNSEWAIAIGIVVAVSVILLILGRGGSLSVTAAAYGTVAGMLFGVSAALTPSTLDYLHESVGTMLSHWECYALAIAGVARLRAPAGLARHGASCPIRGDGLRGEPCRQHPHRRPPPRRDAQPADVAYRGRRLIGLGLALFGAVVISLAHEAAKDEATGNESTREPVAAV